MCQSCNSCQTCNTCNRCHSCQYRCQLSAQIVSQECSNSFSFRNETLKKDDLFLTAEEWNRLISYIHSGYDLQDNYNSSLEEFSKYQGKDIRAGKSYNNEFMSAHMFNGAFAKMKYLGSNDSSLGSDQRNPGEVIKASYFNDLETYAIKDMQIQKGTRCVTCNICETCDNCQICVSCNGVNGCCNSD